MPRTDKTTVRISAQALGGKFLADDIGGAQIAVLAGLVMCFCFGHVEASDAKVKVFILAGQSNMEGHGQIRSLDRLGEHKKHGQLLKKLKKPDGAWAVRKDVTIAWSAKEQKSGPLTIGWGSSANEIGPELMFGTIVGEHFDEPVLLIKAAWGGKDVYCDFRSPSAGKVTPDEEAVLEKERVENRGREVGAYYPKLVAEIKQCLANIDEIVPGYDGQGCEIVGMAWLQGWNDFCEWHVHFKEKNVGPGLIKRYPHNLAAMFRDLRKDLGAPDMPIVIGELGIGGHEIEKTAKDQPKHEAYYLVEFRKAKRAVAADRSLKNVTFVPTAEFWDARLQELRELSDKYWEKKQREKIEDNKDLPTDELQAEFERLGGNWYCHYNGSAANYSLIGYALANALLEKKR